jgi:hypothetical protein
MIFSFQLAGFVPQIRASGRSSQHNPRYTLKRRELQILLFVTLMSQKCDVI